MQPRISFCSASRIGKLIALLLLLLASLGASGEKWSPNALKVAFIINFTKFVTWPYEEPEAAAQERSLFKIAVVDYEALRELLEDYGKEALEAQGVQFEPFDPLKIGTTSQCDFLFINISSEDEIKAALRATSGTRILTIGQSKDFPALGGMINFVPKGNKIGFEINLKAVEAADLVLSSHLIRLGQIVEGSVVAASSEDPSRGGEKSGCKGGKR